MKAMGAFGFFLLFLAAMALINLRNLDPAEESGDRELLATDLDGSRWRLAALRGSPGAAAGEIEVLFTPDGTVRGGGTCHAFEARYQLTEGALHFQDAGMSPSHCGENEGSIEPALVEQLGRTAAATTDGTRLVFLAADGTRLIRFQKVEQR